MTGQQGSQTEREGLRPADSARRSRIIMAAVSVLLSLPESPALTLPFSSHVSHRSVSNAESNNQDVMLRTLCKDTEMCCSLQANHTNTAGYTIKAASQEVH